MGALLGLGLIAILITEEINHLQPRLLQRFAVARTLNVGAILVIAR